MRVLAHACILGLAVLLISCGCGGKKSGKTGVTAEELEAKLESIKADYEGECTDCDGTGKVLNEDGRQVPCDACKGTGQVKEKRGAPVEEFYEVVGVPTKRERRDLIWEWWYFTCRDGQVRIAAFEVEERGDIARVVTAEVETIK